MKICNKILIHSMLVIAWLTWTPVYAQASFIDAIIAIVEDDVITDNELQKEVSNIRQEMRAKGRELPDNPSLYRQVLELMINQSILKQEALRRGVTVTETQLNTTMQNLAQRNQKTLAEFREVLLAEGIDYNDFRDQIKDKLLISSIQTSYARNNVDITEQEVDDFIKRSGADSDSLEYKLAHILVALPDGATSEQVTQAREEVQGLLKKLRNGASFTELANEFSAGSNALQGGDLGWRKLAEVPSLFTPLAQKLKVNEYSEPVRSPSGFHIVTLTDKRDSAQVIVQQMNARHILIKPDTLTSDEDARTKLESLREQILQGADFGELAKAHSDDPGSKGLEGDLGWFEPKTMVPAFEKMLLQTEPDTTSPVFRSQFGWHILQVLGTKIIDETEESKRNTIRTQLSNQKRDEVLELWQRRLRDQAFVKIITS